MSGIVDLLQSKASVKEKMLAVLIDPDTATNPELLISTVQNTCMGGADLIFVGGSLLTTDLFHECIDQVRTLADRPVVLFPGDPAQISDKADAMLFLSLISGRNPEYLIGHQISAAPKLMNMDLETIPTGYMLIDGGRVTTAHYVSQTDPIPHDNAEIAAATAQAGELLGMKLIYMDTGSGAKVPVHPTMIEKVKQAISLPLIVGGGIRTPEQAVAVCNAGADVVVIGTAFEEDPDAIFALTQAVHSCSKVERDPS
jgi:putative glycerol-1-phosphate prenyltransferase